MLDFISCKIHDFFIFEFIINAILIFMGCRPRHPPTHPPRGTPPMIRDPNRIECLEWSDKAMN